MALLSCVSTACSIRKRHIVLLPRVFWALHPRHAGLFSFSPVPPRPQARQTNRGPRRATMPACRPLHGSKPTGAGQQFGQDGHRRRANAITQVFWAIACSTRWACWPIDRPQSRCFFWLLFFSAEKKSDEPRPAGRGTRPVGRPPAPVGAKPRRRRKAAPLARSRAAGANPAPRRRKARARRRAPPRRATRDAPSAPIHPPAEAPRSHNPAGRLGKSDHTSRQCPPWRSDTRASRPPAG